VRSRNSGKLRASHNDGLVGATDSQPGGDCSGAAESEWMLESPSDTGPKVRVRSSQPVPYRTGGQRRVSSKQRDRTIQSQPAPSRLVQSVVKSSDWMPPILAATPEDMIWGARARSSAVERRTGKQRVGKAQYWQAEGWRSTVLGSTGSRERTLTTLRALTEARKKVRGTRPKGQPTARPRAVMQGQPTSA
jgi:hypothetical protein